MPPSMTPRRSPPPWTLEEYNDACFIVRDNNGQGLGYFYFEEEPGRREAASVRANSGLMHRSKQTSLFDHLRRTPMATEGPSHEMP
jgi:hypothetical protein